MAKQKQSCSNRELNLRFKRGTQFDWSLIYRQLQPAALMWAMKYMRNITEAEDIAQRAFLILWRKRAQFRHQCALSSFFYTIVRSECLMQLRQHRRQAKIVGAVLTKEHVRFNVITTKDDWLRRVEAKSAIKRINQKFNRLNDSYKKVIKLRAVGYDMPQIPPEVDMTLPAVKSSIWRFRKAVGG